MERIELTQQEVSLINKHLEGKVNAFTLSKEEQQVMNKLIDKAATLEEELDAIDERFEMPNADLLAWYYKKFKDQEVQE